MERDQAPTPPPKPLETAPWPCPLGGADQQTRRTSPNAASSATAGHGLRARSIAWLLGDGRMQKPVAAVDHAERGRSPSPARGASRPPADANTPLAQPGESPGAPRLEGEIAQPAPDAIRATRLRPVAGWLLHTRKGLAKPTESAVATKGQLSHQASWLTGHDRQPSTRAPQHARIGERQCCHQGRRPTARGRADGASTPGGLVIRAARANVPGQGHQARGDIGVTRRGPPATRGVARLPLRLPDGSGHRAL